MTNEELVRAALEKVGGKSNVLTATNCMTRLRVRVKDDAKIDDEGLNPAGKLDNVSMPTYLKYAEALGMYEAPAKAKPGPASTASPAQQALNDMRRGLSIVS